MNFALKTRNFALKTRNFALETRNCVSKTRNFVLNDEFLQRLTQSMVGGKYLLRGICIS